MLISVKYTNKPVDIKIGDYAIDKVSVKNYSK